MGPDHVAHGRPDRLRGTETARAKARNVLNSTSRGSKTAMSASRKQRRRWEEQANEANLKAIQEGRQGGHPDIDRRVLALTRITVARIDTNPALVHTGLENIRRWTRQKGGYLPQCHAEWRRLIEQHPWEMLREMLLEESDEGQRLRSSHPFKGIVTETERRRIQADDSPAA